MNARESYKRRKELVRAALEERGFDVAIFVSEAPCDNGHPPPPNLLYMCGIAYEEVRTPKLWPINGDPMAYILDKNGTTSIVVTPLNGGKEAFELPEYFDHVVCVEIGMDKLSYFESYVKAIKECIEKFHPKGKIGIDLTTTSAMFASLLGKALKIPMTENVDIHDIIYKLRLIKDDYELAEISRAIDITEKMIMEVAEKAKPGVSKNKLIKQAQARAIMEGAIHSFPNFLELERRDIIKYGDLLFLDGGCRMPSGYFSDMCRVIPVAGALTPKIKDFLEKKIQVHKSILKFFREGVCPADIVSETNKLHRELGWEPITFFGHHVGLEIHDVPDLFQKLYKQPLRSGMVLTYEPVAIDKKARLGCIMEDEILVTPNGGKVMSSLAWDFLW